MTHFKENGHIRREYATGRKRIEKAYTDIRNEIQNPIDVWPAIIDRLGFSMNFDKRNGFPYLKRDPLLSSPIIPLVLWMD